MTATDGQLAAEKYVSFVTFRRTGDRVATPTWIVPLGDGRVGFWTSSASGKVKRLRNNPAVTLQSCDARGRIREGSSEQPGVAAIVSGGADYDTIQKAVRAKYGAVVHLTKLLNTLGHLGKGRFPYGDVGIVINLQDQSPQGG